MKHTFHPKSENVLRVINLFESVLPYAKGLGHLDMNEADICDNYKCGTPHCHGGWFGIALLENRLESICKSYSDAAHVMATMLGFPPEVTVLESPMQALMDWAAENPKIWGNENGTFMFTGDCAFKGVKRPYGATSLKHIVDHWREVYERLLIVEGKKPATIKSKTIVVEKKVYVAVDKEIRKKARLVTQLN